MGTERRSGNHGNPEIPRIPVLTAMDFINYDIKYRMGKEREE